MIAQFEDFFFSMVDAFPVTDVYSNSLKFNY